MQTLENIRHKFSKLNWNKCFFINGKYSTAMPTSESSFNNKKHNFQYPSLDLLAILKQKFGDKIF